MLDLADRVLIIALFHVAQAEHVPALNVLRLVLGRHDELADGVVQQAHLLVGDAQIIVGIRILLDGLLLHAFLEILEDIVEALLLRGIRAEGAGRRRCSVHPAALRQDRRSRRTAADDAARPGADCGRTLPMSLSSAPRSKKSSSAGRDGGAGLPAAALPALPASRQLEERAARGGGLDFCLSWAISCIRERTASSSEELGPSCSPMPRADAGESFQPLQLVDGLGKLRELLDIFLLPFDLC